MIKCDMGEIKLDGTKIDVLSEFSTIVHALKERKIFTEEELRNAFEDGFKTPGEIEEEITEVLMGILHRAANKENKHD